jgi:hypothetical protein
MARADGNMIMIDMDYILGGVDEESVSKGKFPLGEI